jgi:hypothetical protein
MAPALRMTRNLKEKLPIFSPILTLWSAFMTKRCERLCGKAWQMAVARPRRQGLAHDCRCSANGLPTLAAFIATFRNSKGR